MKIEILTAPVAIAVAICSVIYGTWLLTAPAAILSAYQGPAECFHAVRAFERSGGRYQEERTMNRVCEASDKRFAAIGHLVN